MLKFMLDTNVVIYVIKRRPVEVLHTFNQHVSKSYPN
jgi:tRNA(fMet)-specific endonuclease VapC